MEVKPCIGCGYCCSMPCTLSYFSGWIVDRKCIMLVWDAKAGRHWCKAILDDIADKYNMAIGGGCSSTLFNDWREELKDRT